MIFRTLENEWRNKKVRTESLTRLKEKKEKTRENLKKLKETYKFNFDFNDNTYKGEETKKWLSM